MMGDVPFPKTPEKVGEEERRGAKVHQLSTRTIAILTGVACKTHRLAIQSRISQNGFTILSERLEEWVLASDQDFLSEFLRDEERKEEWMVRLTGAPIYVMILERHCAVEEWQAMCGPDVKEGEDAGLDEDGLPISRAGLRARYGAGAVYASTVEGAPRQIAICFPDLASIQAIEALNAEQQQPSTYAATGSDGGFLVRADDDIVYDEDGRAFDAHSGEPLELEQELLPSVKSPSTNTEGQGRIFKARALPHSTREAKIKPRLSKAAALRMGVPLPQPPKRTISNTSSNDASRGISGLPRVGVAVPKSLMAPSVAPRMNRAAAGRTKTASSPEKVEPIKERKPIDFSNTPGHKRLSLSSSRPASLAAPTVVPRLNKATTARLGDNAQTGEVARGRSNSSIDVASPSRSSASISPVAVRKPVDFSNTPGHKRASLSSSGIKSLQAPSVAPRANRVSEGRNGSSPPKSQHNNGGNGSTKTDKANALVERRAVDYSNTPGHKRQSGHVSIASLSQPTIVPRSNASAMKRLSLSGTSARPEDHAREPLRQSRPASAMADSNPSSKLREVKGTGGQDSRPASRSSVSSAAHQDGSPHPRSLRTGAGPPSSFRM